MFEILCSTQGKIRDKKYNVSFIGSPSRAAAYEEAVETVGTEPQTHLFKLISRFYCLQYLIDAAFSLV